MTDQERQNIMDGVYRHPRRSGEWRILSWGERFMSLRSDQSFAPVAVVPADGFVDASSWERIQ